MALRQTHLQEAARGKLLDNGCLPARSCIRVHDRSSSNLSMRGALVSQQALLCLQLLAQAVNLLHSINVAMSCGVPRHTVQLQQLQASCFHSVQLTKHGARHCGQAHLLLLCAGGLLGS